MNKGKIIFVALLSLFLVFGMVLASCDNGTTPTGYNVQSPELGGSGNPVDHLDFDD